jgi:hypothetical protein
MAYECSRMKPSPIRSKQMQGASKHPPTAKIWAAIPSNYYFTIVR